jgi:hypothetical protein
VSVIVDRFGIELGISAGVLAGLFAGSVSQKYTSSPTRGVLAGQVDLLIAKSVLVNTAAALTLDLTAIPNQEGVNVNFVKLTHLVLLNDSKVAGENFTLFGGANGVWAADPKKLNANGGAWIFCDPDLGFTVDGAHKIIRLAADAGAAVPLRYVIAGRSA